MAVRIPQLKESLCGCSLRTGTKVIGWISVSINIVILLILIFLASLDMQVLKDVIAKEIGSDEKADEILTVVGIVIFLVAAFAMVSILFDVLLLVGVYNDRKGCVIAWIVYQSVIMVISLFFTIGSSGNQNAGNLFFNILGTGLSLYLMLVVYSHYNNLKERRSSITSPPAYEI